jgi:hypothetical protein
MVGELLLPEIQTNGQTVAEMNFSSDLIAKSN